jgi:hypothetical protein
MILECIQAIDSRVRVEDPAYLWRGIVVNEDYE